MKKNKNLLLNGKVYQCLPGETILAALQRHKVEVPYACQKMSCMTCIMRSLNGTPPAKAQQNLKETLQLQNYFLACGCIPHQDMEIAILNETLTQQVSAEVIELNYLSPVMMELLLQCDIPIDYHGGQSVLLPNYEQIGKKFSIASPTSAKISGKIEIHVEHIAGGPFSEWMFNKLKTGDTLLVSGVSGELFYNQEHPQQPLLLAGWNGGLSALIGVVQDIFEQGHSEPVLLFHGASDPAYLYYHDELQEIEQYFPNFKFFPCIDQAAAPQGCYSGSVQEIIPQTISDLHNWKVFLCGNRKQVHPIQRHAYLAGAGMKDIYLEITAL